MNDIGMDLYIAYEDGYKAGYAEAERKKKCKPTTNADRIRAMTDEELARWICNISDCPYCPGKELECQVGERGIMTGVLDWLKSPVEANK